MTKAPTNKFIEVSHSLGLLGVLISKNLRVRFRGARLGFLWLILQPALQGTVIAFVFTRVAPRLVTSNYPLFVLAGVIPWALTTRALLSGTTSLADNAAMVKKVAVPRAIFPLAAVGATAAASLVGVTLLVPVSAWFGELSWDVALLPLAVLLHLWLVLPAAILLSALFVRNRDLRFAVESAIVILFYASPIIYPSERLGDLAYLQRWNPVTGVLSLYRTSLTDLPPDWVAVSISLGCGAAVLMWAITAFRARAGEFADLL